MCLWAQDFVSQEGLADDMESCSQITGAVGSEGAGAKGSGFIGFRVQVWGFLVSSAGRTDS